MNKLRKYITAAVFIMGSISLLWLAGFGAFVGYVSIQKPQERAVHTDAIVVLTGGSNRIHTGLDLLSQGLSEHLLISGVDSDVSIEDIRKIWRPEESSLPCCIALGHDALNTRGNAQEVKRWMEENGYTSLRLVTSNYHMPRTIIEFRRAMPNIPMIKHAVKIRHTGGKQTPGDNINFLKVAFGEYNKTLLTLTRAFFPKGSDS